MPSPLPRWAIAKNGLREAWLSAPDLRRPEAGNGPAVGGGGGSRTRVRWRSAIGSTCLGASIHLARSGPTARALAGELDSFNAQGPERGPKARSCCFAAEFSPQERDRRRRRLSRPPARSRCRWQLLQLQRWINESRYPLGMRLLLHCPRRSRIAPGERRPA